MERKIKLLPNLIDRRIALVLEHESNPVYFRYLWVILLNACRQGATVTIFDCDWDRFQYSNRNHDPLRKAKISKIRDKFLKSLSSITRDAVKVIKIDANQILIEKKTVKEVSSFSLADDVHLQLGNSLRSVFARNYLSTSNLNLQGTKMRKYFRMQVQSFLSMRLICTELFLPEQFDLILIPNGRFPSQTAMRVVAENASIEFYFYEHGMPKKESFHFAPFQTQEFLKMQDFIQLQIKDRFENNSQEILEFANQWLCKQATDVKQNQYLNQDLKKKVARDLPRDKPLAVIFNSSIDEKFSNMGVELNGWVSQKQGIKEIAKVLVQQGFQVIVRIHPNTANKSWWDLINLVNFLKAEKIDFILPWSGPSSYELLEEAKLVLTWGSTISMESSARGIPTAVFGRTMFDEIAGAIIVNPSTLRSIDFNKLAKSDPVKGKIAIYFSKHWGYNLQEYCLSGDLELIDLIVDNQKQPFVSSELSEFSPSFVKSLLLTINEVFILLRRIRMGRYASPNDYRKLAGKIFSKKFADHAANTSLYLGLKIRALRRDGEVSI